MLSAAQARSMLEAVARAHLAKMERVAVMETADGVTADEGGPATVSWAGRGACRLHRAWWRSSVLRSAA
jgi:hypothetical protein